MLLSFQNLACDGEVKFWYPMFPSNYWYQYHKATWQLYLNVAVQRIGRNNNNNYALIQNNRKKEKKKEIFHAEKL